MRTMWGVGALLLAMAVPAGAQETLTLDDVLERAAEYNPGYRQQLNNLELAGAERREAIGAFLPSLNLSLNSGLGFNRQTKAFDNFGNPIANPVTEWRTTSNSGQSASLSLNLFEGLTRFHGIDQANATADAREMAATASLAQIEATLRLEFSTSMRQRALLEIEQAARAGRAQDLIITRELFRLADVSAVDVRSAELDVLQLERRIAQARTAYRQALLNLRAEIGDPSLSEFEVDDQVAEPFDPAVLDVEMLVQMALERNPTIRQQVANVTRDQAGLKAAKGSRWPSLSLSANFRQSDFADEYDAFLEGYSTASRSAGVSLSLSVPVFRQFQTSRQIAAADVALRNTQQTLRETELDIERDVRSQHIALQDQWENYQSSLQTRDLAEEALQLAREEYRLASITFDQLQTRIDAALQERRNVVNAQYDFLNALINLEQTVGTGVSSSGQGG